jgi:hypothetical protein
MVGGGQIARTDLLIMGLGAKAEETPRVLKSPNIELDTYVTGKSYRKVC